MAFTDVVNPFINSQLRIPSRYRDAVEEYTTTQQSQKDPSKAPFRRYVDMWWAAMCIGVQEGRRSEQAPDDWHRFIDGAILSSDPWRIIHLQLMAIGVEGSVEILDKPNEVIQMANEFAAEGLPLLVNEIEAARAEEPIMVASQFLRSRCITLVPEQLLVSGQGI